MYKYGRLKFNEFEWDEFKDLANQKKHGVSFTEAMESFLDPDAIKLIDDRHSEGEERFYWVGKSKSGVVITVWYTNRGSAIRIIGAGQWRKMRRLYERTKPKVFKS